MQQNVLFLKTRGTISVHLAAGKARAINGE